MGRLFGIKAVSQVGGLADKLLYSSAPDISLRLLAGSFAVCDLRIFTFSNQFGCLVARLFGIEAV